jgi:manganese/zinc/iron transport system substrate-binding protein
MPTLPMTASRPGRRGLTPPPRLGAWLLVTAGVLMSITGCGAEPGDDAPGRDADAASASAGYRVVATVGMVTDLVERIAGERATVEGLMSAGIDPHLYKPTRSDVQKLMQADVVFYNGLLLEGKMTDALIRAATAGKKVHAVTELIDESSLLAPEAFEGHFDPHVWMDPTAWSKAIDVIRDRLIEHDPAGEAGYRQRADALRLELEALDAYAMEVLHGVPEQERVLVTAHDAFNYFGRRYGYEVVGIQGISTESEAGVRDIERLVDLLVDRGVRAVFVESTVSQRNIRALIDGAAARGHAVVVGGELFSDAMGEPGTYRGTYVGMIDHNASTIAAALGGDVPAGGMRGELDDEP